MTVPSFDGHEYESDDAFAGMTMFRSSWPALWNFWVGGKDNQAPDQTFGRIVADEHPEIWRIAALRLAARARLVRYLVAAAGIRQLIVADCDLPAHDEVHDVAHRVDPHVRVLYATGHPVVMTHARGLLSDAGTTGHVDAPATDPAAILAGAAPILDLDEPVGVLLLNTLDVLDTGTAHHVTRAFADALAPGSHIALTHLTAKGASLAGGRSPVGHELRDLFTLWRTPPPVLRHPAEITHLLDDWDLLEPGVTPVPHWRPETLLHHLDPDLPGQIRLVVAAARKPGPRPARSSHPELETAQ